MVRPDNSPAFWSLECPHRRKFKVLTRNLSALYGISLTVPLFHLSSGDRLGQLKRFCSAPLERLPHEWDVSVKSLSKRSRFSIWFSLFLFRKTLPAKGQPVEKLWTAVTQNCSPDADPAFLRYVREETKKMFRPGWDSGWGARIRLASATTRSCVQNSRMHGGNRMFWLEELSLDETGSDPRLEFCRVLRGERPLSWPLRAAKFTNVETAGKVRCISIPPAEFSFLRPLNNMIYDHLSRFSWLLRGDAKPSSFGDFGLREGEVFVSGDYESATDNLNLNVQKEILQTILEGSVVSDEVKRLALYSQESLVTYPDGPVAPLRHGQMMGFPLSFPLLCLVNYLSFRFYVPRRVPVRINGDDIVFRCHPSEYGHWSRQVEKSGLKLSVGKTLVDRSIFTLNSTLFIAGHRRTRLLPFIRSKPLFGVDGDGLTSVVGRFSSFAPGFRGWRRSRLRVSFLRENVGWISSTGRSLTRGLGMNVTKEELREARMWSRELAYLQLPKERPPPAPFSVWERKPLGFVIDYSEEKKEVEKKYKDLFVEACVAACWARPDDDPERYRQYFVGGSSYQPIKWRRSLLGCSGQELRLARRKSDEEVWAKAQLLPRLRPYFKYDPASVEDYWSSLVESYTHLRCELEEPNPEPQISSDLSVDWMSRGVGFGPPPGLLAGVTLVG